MSLPSYDKATNPFDLASPWRRLAAYLIDITLVLVFIRLGTFVLNGAFRLQPSWASSSLYSYVDITIVSLAVLYYLFCDALPNGQSLGKRIMKIAVVGYIYRTRCTLFQSFLRNAPKYLLSLLDVIFIFFGDRRRLGDMLASTLVVNRRPTADKATAETAGLSTQ